MNSMQASEGLEITHKDVIEMLDLFTRVPPLLLKIVIKRNSNLVGSFQDRIEDYKNTLSPEDIQKIKIITNMPIEELQEILNDAYQETQQVQLKILSDPKAQPFITQNMHELEKIIFS
ncbi:MAG: hypothetical protein LLF83_09120 [Methanobacterium sp.]|nr:hypothetical protein [Methanobacterium sp.]